jgi:hypothetical protein
MEFIRAVCYAQFLGMCSSYMMEVADGLKQPSNGCLSGEQPTPPDTKSHNESVHSSSLELGKRPLSPRVISKELAVVQTSVRQVIAVAAHKRQEDISVPVEGLDLLFIDAHDSDLLSNGP